MKTICLDLSKISTTIFRAFMLGLMCLFCQTNMLAIGGIDSFVDECDGISYHVSYYFEYGEHEEYSGKAAVLCLASNNEDATYVKIPAYVCFTDRYQYNYPINYIHDRAFSNTLIETFISENNDIGISYEMFSGCKYLSEVNLGEEISCIAESAFKNCTALQNITIPPTTYIYGNAFEGCSALTEVVITDFIIEEKTSYSPEYQIGKKAFTGCSALRNVVLKCTEVPSCAWAAFDADTYATATLFVPEGTLQAYRDDRVWGRFQHIVEGNNSAIIGVDAPAATDGICDIYSLSGMLLRQGVQADSWKSDLAPGIYIIRTSDGSSRKAVVR